MFQILIIQLFTNRLRLSLYDCFTRNDIFCKCDGEPKSNDAISNVTFIYFNCQQDGKINIPAKATRRWKATTLFKIVFTNLHTLHVLRLDQICGGSFYLNNLFAIHCAYHLQRYFLCSIDVDAHNYVLEKFKAI